jgi:hypothetical protein
LDLHGDILLNSFFRSRALNSYTEMALEFPGQIVKIFIRDITTARLKEMVSKIPPTRSLSFSSLLLPKTPLGFFSRRGSNTNTIGSVTSNANASTSNVATMSSTDDDYDNDNDEDDDDEDIDHSNNNNTIDDACESGIRHDLGEFALERPRYPHHGGPMSPRMDPSGPLTPPTMSLSTTPTSSTASSPRLQPKQITATVKAVFGSPFRRSSPNNTSGNNNLNAVNGWNALRKRGGSMSPASPLSEGVNPMTGYPFPKVSSATSSSISSSSEHQQRQQHQRSRRSGGAYDDEDYGLNSNLLYSYPASPSQAQHVDIFDGQDHQHVMLQQQQQQQQRTRQRTLSFTPITNSPPRSPKIPIRRTIGFFARQEPHPLEIAMSATSPLDGPLDNKNVNGTEVGGQGGAVEPQSTSPSLSPSSPSSPVATTPTSFTNPKNPLEVWQERIQQCHRRLPKGVLTLFESAEQLEQCKIVQDVFKKYGGESSSNDQDQGRMKTQAKDGKGIDHRHGDGDVSTDAQSEFLVKASLNTGKFTSTTTTTTTTATSSSFSSNQDSFSVMTTRVKSVSVSPRITSDHDVGGILRSVVAN